YWILRDQVAAQGTHRYDLHFHFTADANPEIERQPAAPAVRERTKNRPGLDLFTFGNQGAWRREDGWVSPCYGTRIPAPVLIFSAQGDGDQEFVTFLVPRAAHAADSQVREIEARDGRAFEVCDGGARDL